MFGLDNYFLMIIVLKTGQYFMKTILINKYKEYGKKMIKFWNN
jgi:hypothetical protein